MTPRQAWVLERLQEGEELVYETGAGGWVGDEQVAPRTVFALIRLMAISLESDPKDVGRRGCVERYLINETGRTLLARHRGTSLGQVRRRAR